jgi:hypothetical protein
MTTPSWQAYERFYNAPLVVGARKIGAETPIFVDAYCALVDQGIEPAKVAYDLDRRLRNFAPLARLIWAMR